MLHSMYVHGMYVHGAIDRRLVALQKRYRQPWISQTLVVFR